MPNTLAHLGVQLLATRAVLRESDPKWIYLGCILPDLPWILQRATRAALPEVSAYDLRLYVIVQSSFFMCLVLAGAFSAFSSRPGRVFSILAFGSFLHLVMDALQQKWASGVHLFAPFSWELSGFGLFWPEDPTTYALTGLGLLVFALAWWRLPCRADDLVRPGGRAMVVLGVLIPLYLLGPVLLRSGPEAADNHSVKTLRESEARAGLAVEIDRGVYLYGEGGGIIRTFAGEAIAVRGIELSRPARVSIRGRFLDPGTIQVSDWHEHRSLARDLASYLGLALVLAYWARAVRPRLMAWIGRPRRG